MLPSRVWHRWWILPLLVLVGATIGSAEPTRETEPENSGPVKLTMASWLGGPFDDQIVSVEIAPDSSIVLAGNGADVQFPGVKPTILGAAGTFDKTAAPPPPPTDPKKKAPKWQHPSQHGFVVRLSADGTKVLSHTRFGYGAATIRKMRLDGKGNIVVLANANDRLDLGVGATDKGTFVVGLGADASKATKLIAHPNTMDFGVDSNGEIVVLTKAKLTRYTADGKTAKWTATWKSHGDNRPGAMTISPDTGVAAVTGYGMTHTGKEPYKDPYGYGFDREGNQVWALWNPDPKKEKATKFSTDSLKCNGLMADTTGQSASAGSNGKIFFMLFADGGNSVCTRDPLDVDKPLDKNVFAGVHQAGPGHGFKGASKTSVIFRIDSQKGTIEKGTWMSAWLSPQRANGLGIDAAVSDETGRQFLVGGSAFGCPTAKPWYQCKEGGYVGGGFLAVMDPEFKMLQCGYFPAANLGCVAVRGGTVVVAGSAKQYEDEASKTTARVYKPLQKEFGGGKLDGYFAVFQAGK